MYGVISVAESRGAMQARRRESGIINHNLILGRSRGRPITLEDVYRLVLDLGDQLDRIEQRFHEQEQRREREGKKETPDVSP